ncbi:hypothetical protein Nepgr_014174 [Nepenthes gracilis]|uniref:Exocyst subunit Exo70 family protein n=1 Tax=Nepenthes gracilis TaxID=150966 RepID=A0AAD3SJ04_NEPGR|nr:hypothetical protein Nepgr_014174 [Nepenthes gracilis]
MAADNGEEKLIAVARHIAKTLGHTDTITDDILQIFSNFDGRFSREKLSEKMSDDDRRTCAELEDSLTSLYPQISLYVSSDHSIWSDSADSAAFLDAVDELLAAIRDWSPLANEKAVAACLDRADDLMQQAMFRLEDEFRSLMERGGESFDLKRSIENGGSTRKYSYDSDENDEDENGEIPVAQPISDYNIVIDTLPSGTISDLHEIAKRMVAAEYGKECSHVHSNSRREFLEESLSRLGLQKLSIEEVQKMPWSDLGEEIERWTKAANVALRILFPSERQLCDRVFFGFSNAGDRSFMEVCRGSTIQLLNFADAIAISSRSPERLFKVLDLYETLRDLIPEFEILFSDQYCVSLRNEAITIWKRVAECIRGTFMELENLIRRDPAKAAVPGGGLHPITRYVMNYLRAACKSHQTLEQVFEERIVYPGDYKKLDNRASTTSLSVQMAWIMELLESNLEAKSKIYPITSLSSVFLMNNGRYIVQKVKDSELGRLLGDDWIRKHNAKVRQLHVNYQRSSWNKVLGVLKSDSGSLASNTAAPKLLKDRLKLFNTYFEEICKTQSTWVIFDDQLREELKISVTENMLPAYRSFLGRFQASPEAGRNADKYIKYTVEDVEARINNELFQGVSGKKC